MLARVRPSLALLLAALTGTSIGVSSYRSVSAQESPDPSKKAEALKHFEIGLELFKNEAWDSALAEFLKSRELYPTRNALKNAAACLKELKRYDEALDMYDELLSRFALDLPADDRTAVDAETTKLSKFVGLLLVESDEAGARVVVDGRERGVTPLPKAVRVTVGTRAVTVTKAGHAPFETKVMIASGETAKVQATLTALAQSGTVSVTEKEGRALEVVVDGAVVGKTPWEGTLSAGTHSVALRGPNDLGTVPQAIVVVTGKKAELELLARTLDAELRVEVTPGTARILVDGKEVGVGRFEGRLSGGVHALEVALEGYVTERQQVMLSPKTPAAVQVTLSREKRFYGELFGGAMVYSPNTYFPKTAQADVDSAMVAGAALRGGYLVLPRFGVELAVGLLWEKSAVTRRAAATATGLPGSANATDFKEEMRVLAPFAAISASYRLLDATPLLLRLWAGVARESVTTGGNGNSGTFAMRPLGAATLLQRELEAAERTVSVFVPMFGPEVRFGVRLNPSFVLDLGVTALLFLQPETDHGPVKATFTAPAPAGITNPQMTDSNGLKSGVAFVVLPSLAFHFDF